ncbi:MAG: hypothetical protein II839_09160, partial [Kiritimatiellae bacterium]|nr:hypothetical protein [Kiritimatiellia bacterium]
VAVLVGLFAALWPSGAGPEEPAAPEETAPDGGVAAAAPDTAPPTDGFVYEGPVEIVPVLPAPRSFAK